MEKLINQNVILLGMNIVIYVSNIKNANSSLSSIANSISKINKKECKACMERKNIKSKCDQLSYKCKKCNKKWLKPVNELIKKCSSVLNKLLVTVGDLNKFVLLLRKGVYPYEDMDSWEKFNKLQYHLKKHFTAN